MLRVAKRAIQSWRRGEPELHLLPRLCSRDRWSVDVGANGHGFAGVCALQQSDDTGFGDVALHFQAKAFQNVGDMGAGLEFFKSQFRIFMEVATDADQFGQIFLTGCFQCVCGNG